MGLPCCRGNITCSLDEFLMYFKETVDNCHFDEMCALPKDTSTTPKASVSIICSDILLIMIILMVTFKLSQY